MDKQLQILINSLKLCSGTKSYYKLVDDLEKALSKPTDTCPDCGGWDILTEPCPTCQNTDTPKDTEIYEKLEAIIKGLGYSFVEGNVEVSFVDGVLPPRFSYEVQFRTAEDVFAESIHSKEEKSEVLLSAGSLLDPIIPFEPYAG